MAQLFRITPRKYRKLCWTAFQHLTEFSVPYTLSYAISKNDCVYLFSLLSSWCYSSCVVMSPRGQLSSLQKLFFLMIVNNDLSTTSWFWYHWLISTTICVFWERGKLIFCCRFINAIKRLEFILRFKIYSFFRVS